MSKHKKIRYIIHYVKPTAQLLFKIGFPKGGPTCRRQVVNPLPRNTILQNVMGCSFANTEWHFGCIYIYIYIYTSYNRTHIRNAYIYIYINTELLDGNQGHQEVTHHPSYRFRRLFLDLLSMGWRGCASAMGAIKLPTSWLSPKIICQSIHII